MRLTTCMLSTVEYQSTIGCMLAERSTKIGWSHGNVDASNTLTSTFTKWQKLEAKHAADLQAQVVSQGQYTVSLSVGASDIAREAFGVSLPVSSIERRGLQDLDPAVLAALPAGGHAWRLLATCSRQGDRLHARVDGIGHLVGGIDALDARIEHLDAKHRSLRCQLRQQRR